jgi:acyl-CoA dehydrogenase
MNELQNILEESIIRVFDEEIDNDFLAHVEDTGWPAGLWATINELGLPGVLVSEQAGGMGGSWVDAYVVVRRCGSACVPLPIPEAILAAWLAERAGLQLPDGAPGLISHELPSSEIAADTYSGVVSRIPWGGDATYYLGITSAQELIVIGRDGVEIESEKNLGQDPRDQATFTNSPILQRAPVTLPADAVRWLCAMLRSAQIAGASSRCLEIALQYVSEREQFGRTLSRFQAIQHHLAVMAGEIATVESMSANAFYALDRHGIGTGRRDAGFEIAAAKCRASDAVEAITRIGHQVHGAIGFTYEYGFHFLTRRLWSWRAEFGGSNEWAHYLGEIAKKQGGDDIWAYITH